MYSTASGVNSHAEGIFALAYGHTSHAEGMYTLAYGLGSHAEGTGMITPVTANVPVVAMSGSNLDYTVSAANVDKLKIGYFLNYGISYAISGANNEEVSHQLQKDVVNTFDILMRYIFSIFILRTIIHKHRILSITLIFCGFVILLPADFLLINGKDEISMTTTLFYVGILVLRSISLPLEDTIIKQLLSDSYILPEYLMFLRGIFEAIIIICITPILYYSFGIKWAIYFEKKHIIISQKFKETNFKF